MSFWTEHKLYESIKPGSKVYLPIPIEAMQIGWEVAEATEESLVLRSSLPGVKDTVYLNPHFLGGVVYTGELSVTILLNR